MPDDGDIIDKLFADEKAADERYPGSKRTRRQGNAPKPLVPSEPERWDRKSKKLWIPAESAHVECFTIGQLALALNRKPVTIRSWELKGVMPKARLRDGHGRRWYTRNQVEGLIRIAQDEGILDFDVRPDTIPKSFTDRVMKLWKEPLTVS